MRPATILALGFSGLVVGVQPAAAQPTVLVSAQQAYIAADEGGQAWTIGNAAIAFRVGRGANGALTVLGLDRPGADTHWNPEATPDFSFQSGLVRLTPGSASFPLRSASAEEAAGGVRLSLVFEDPASHLRVTRAYACYPTAPVIETWATLDVIGTAAAIPVSDIGVWQMAVPARDLTWITGLKAGDADGGRFTRRQEILENRGRVDLGSAGRSSDTALPIVWLGGSAGQYFTGLMWSGAWGLAVRGPSPSGLVTVRWTPGATEMSLQGGRPIETPHAFFGITGADPADVTPGLRRFVDEGIRQGRRFNPRVTYNTWFAYGIGVTEKAMLAEMDRAAALGVELFVLDAGWYVGGTQTSDFSTGLGAWTADARRFPSGLRALGDHARSLGMKFGLWVEPERVDTRLLNRAGFVLERGLATTGGRYNAGVKNESATAAQICLADGEARQWVLDQLVRLIDEVRPDYLKWDNNYWINCDRGGHGHGTQDGNFAHVKGLYTILAALRERYPDLVIENCAGGGNRLDFGMLRYTDAAWMDDVSAPSTRVRHNLEGLASVFPAAYLLSFVMDDRTEPVHGAADMSLYFRSRMPGILGVSLINAEFGDEDVEQMTREISYAKRLRHHMRGAVAVLLSDQVQSDGHDRWDAVELCSPSGGTAVLFAFAGAAAPDSAVFALRLLDPGADYVVRTVDGRRLGEASGADLMANGVSVNRTPESAAQVFVITKVVEPG